MTTSNLEFQDLTPIRELFPITKDTIYFDHASTGPMSVPARKAIEECLSTYSLKGQYDFAAYFTKLAKARLTVARFIGAEPEEIVFTTNTSEGIYIALINLPFQESSSVIVMEEVFPTVRYVTDYNIPHVQKIYVPFCGRDPVDVLQPYVNNNNKIKVKAVVIDLVQFFTGETIDLPRLSSYLQEKKIYLVVDGIQAIGMFDMSVREAGIDFLSCGASKWLFSPNGIGFLYVNKKLFPILNRLHTGWLGAAWKSFEDFGVNPPLFDDARMFEQGTRNVMGISALAANCKMMREYGLAQIEKNVLDIKGYLREKLLSRGYKILTPATGRQSGIITAKPSPEKNAQQLYNLLKERRVTVSLRNDCLRFSPHFYNIKDEVEQIANILTM